MCLLEFFVNAHCTATTNELYCLILIPRINFCILHEQATQTLSKLSDIYTQEGLEALCLRILRWKVVYCISDVALQNILGQSEGINCLIKGNTVLQLKDTICSKIRRKINVDG